MHEISRYGAGHGWKKGDVFATVAAVVVVAVPGHIMLCASAMQGEKSWGLSANIYAIIAGVR